MHMYTRTHSKPKRAHNFFMSSAAILKPFLTENEKTEATFQIGIDDAQLFHFIIFFPFWYGSCPKWPKRAKNGKKNHFIDPWWPKY